MRRRLHRLLPVALVACALAPIAGCGGDDDESPRTLLDKAAAKPIPSAEVELRTDADVPGFPILGSRISITADGPFVARGAGGRPEFDLRAVMRAGGQTFPARVSGVDGALYVDFMGQFYEAEEELAGQFGIADVRPGRDGASLRQLGLDPDAWLRNVRVSDGDELGGDSTRVVTGRVDKEAVLEDLLGLVDLEALSRAGGDVEGLDELDRESLEQAAEAIDSAKVEVNVDDDDYPRRVFAELRFTMPKDVEDTAIESGTVTFELELDEIGETTARVEPPFAPDPLSSLLDFAGEIFGIDELSDLWRQPN